jgi:EAL domain-containing protein (putative c-di-GMP-specific phosphodiesterase class I)
VTTEGVETREQSDVLSRLGCDQLQGYYFGKPMPADRVADTMLRNFAANAQSGMEPQTAVPVAV